jgi:hypothetical protein
MDNDNTFCPANMPSCYHYSTATATNAAAASACQAMGGYLVAWNSDPEQLTVRPWPHCLGPLGVYSATVTCLDA